MQNLLSEIQENQSQYQETILNDISDYIYRDERYKSHFAIMLMTIEENFYDKEVFDSILRKTDKLIVLSKNLYAIVFDSVANKSFIKAAENIHYALENKHTNKFFLSVVDSENYQGDFFAMVYKTFEILEFAIEHNISNIVLDIETDLL